MACVCRRILTRIGDGDDAVSQVKNRTMASALHSISALIGIAFAVCTFRLIVCARITVYL